MKKVRSWFGFFVVMTLLCLTLPPVLKLIAASLGHENLEIPGVTLVTILSLIGLLTTGYFLFFRKKLFEQLGNAEPRTPAQPQPSVSVPVEAPANVHGPVKQAMEIIDAEIVENPAPPPAGSETRIHEVNIPPSTEIIRRPHPDPDWSSTTLRAGDTKPTAPPPATAEPQAEELIPTPETPLPHVPTAHVPNVLIAGVVIFVIAGIMAFLGTRGNTMSFLGVVGFSFLGFVILTAVISMLFGQLSLPAESEKTSAKKNLFQKSWDEKGLVRVLFWITVLIGAMLITSSIMITGFGPWFRSYWPVILLVTILISFFVWLRKAKDATQAIAWIALLSSIALTLYVFGLMPGADNSRWEEILGSTSGRTVAKGTDAGTDAKADADVDDDADDSLALAGTETVTKTTTVSKGYAVKELDRTPLTWKGLRAFTLTSEPLTVSLGAGNGFWPSTTPDKRNQLMYRKNMVGEFLPYPWGKSVGDDCKVIEFKSAGEPFQFSLTLSDAKKFVSR